MISRARVVVAVLGAAAIACGGGGSNTGPSLGTIGGGTPGGGTPGGGTNMPPPAPALVSLAVAPATAVVPRGYAAQLTATGTYDDGSTRVVTEEVAWTTSDASAIAVSDAAGSRGVARAPAAASPAAVATVTATHAASGAHASATLTVSAASPAPGSALQLAAAPDDAPDACTTSSVVAGATITVPLGCDALFTASASFTDGSTVDVTPTATWSLTSSTPPGVAALAYAGGREAAGTLKQGTAAVRAALPDDASIAGSAELHVVAPVVAQVAVEPEAATLVYGRTLSLAVVATSTDDSTQTIAPASWTTSDASIATVSAAGLVTAGTVAGTATISALDAGGATLAQATVSVQAPTAAPSLSYVVLAKGSVRAGTSVQGTVVLTAAATGLTAVALSSSGAAATPANATVTVLAGADRATFQVNTSAPTTRRQKVAIRATLGERTVSATLNVRR